MKLRGYKCGRLGMLLLLQGALLLLPLRAQTVPVVEKHLANGLRLLLVERHDEPTVAGGWVAHVGSSNERPGITGIAHLFEHMMFKGTPDHRHEELPEGPRNHRRAGADPRRDAPGGDEDARRVPPGRH